MLFPNTCFLLFNVSLPTTSWSESRWPSRPQRHRCSLPKLQLPGLIVSLLRLTNDCSLGIGSHPEGKGKSVCVWPCWGCRGQNGSLSRSDFPPQTWSGTGHTFLGHNGSFRIFQLGVGGPRNLLFQQVRFLWKLTFFFPLAPTTGQPHIM